MCLCKTIYSQHMRILTALFFAVFGMTAAQTPQVPHKMEFAGISLTIRDDARREIQKDVDALTLSPKHFNIKAERAKTYFPIIEKVFAEEGVPDDFKYLVLQESALIPDAVSSSNAVGFWQFKDFTAIEMGLRVDKEIDERMNIVSASRGAARYIKKNNTFFDNWLYALQAYQMGAGAVMKTAPDNASGASHMEITSKTYWYVKKYLAHKIAFENSVKGPGQVRVTTFENKNRKTLEELAKEIAVEEDALKNHNKWVKSGTIPDDRTYYVLIPVSGNVSDMQLPVAVADTRVQASASKNGIPTPAFTSKTKVNGILVIIAVAGENPTTLASRAKADLTEFLRWNDISITDKITPGRYYFLGKKRNRATEAYHKVLAGEDLWSVSQQYGVQMKKLRKYNRLSANEALKPGETLWLSSKRPKDVGNAPVMGQVAEVDSGDSFSWESNNNVQPTVVSTTILTVPSAELESPKRDVLPEVNSQTAVVDTTRRTQDSSRVVALPVPEKDVQKDSTFTIEVRKTEHVVQPKETLYGIAHQYSVGVMDLVNWNHLNLQDGIRPGQILRLLPEESITADAAPAIEETGELIHEVRASDTLYSVARKYGVTIKELMEWNGKKDFSVTIGEKIKILRR